MFYSRILAVFETSPTMFHVRRLYGEYEMYPGQIAPVLDKR